MTDYELQMTRIKKLEVQPGIEIGYEELGTGDKYVLCTQMGFNEQFYARKFADHGYHVFLLWNRGSGPSSPATEDFGPGWYDVWADDVISFADKKGIDRFVYTGNSHGAGTGWHLLLKHQERVTAFIAFVPGPHNIEEGSSNLREIASKHPEINFLSDNWKDPAQPWHYGTGADVVNGEIRYPYAVTEAQANAAENKYVVIPIHYNRFSGIMGLR